MDHTFREGRRVLAYQFIYKRDGRRVPFDQGKIADAIFAAARAVGGKNRALSEELAGQVVEYLAQTYPQIQCPTVEQIQDAVEKVLVETGHYTTVKAYITYRQKRTRIREAKNELNDVVADILVETGRENANVGNSPSAKMLQIAGAASERYYLNRLIPEEFSEAHRSGRIHIHDREWYGATATCVPEFEYTLIRDNHGEVGWVRFESFNDIFNTRREQVECHGEQEVLVGTDLQIMGRAGWTPINKVMRRKLNPGEPLLRIKTRKGLPLHLTGNHRVPVIREGKEFVVSVDEIQKGDKLLRAKQEFDEAHELPMYEYVNTVKGRNLDSLDVVGVDRVPDYAGYVFDLETGEHWFTVNDYVVHNCLQIPARRLLLEGFNTGHGHIRPAKRISSAMAQVAILIQSNQNEMHGGQSIADFDRALAPFVEREREYWRNILRGLGVEPAEEKLDRLTEQACYQAAEAFVHNSNSMHSLSGSERIWVHDKATGDVRQYSMEEFHLVFEPDRYQAFSLNYDTGRTELKDITASLGHENINRILKLRLKSGQSVKVTDNHSVMALDAEGRVTTARPEDLTAGLVPRAIDMVATDLGFDLTGYPRSYKHKFDYLPLTPELANFLGYYVAEGSVDGSSIYLAIFNEKLEEDVRALLSTISPTFTARVRVGVSGKPRDLVCNVGKTFSNFVGDVCGRGAAAKKIPGQLFFASNDVVRAFLDGYFSGDGTVGKNRVVASSVSKELRDGLQLLLAKLGIPATIRDYSPKTNFASAKRRYLISVGGYHARPEVIDELISDLEVRLASVDLEKVERLTRPEHLFEVVRQAAEPVTTSERIHLLKKVSNGDLPVRTKYLPVLADYSGTLRTLYLSEHRGKFILKNTRQCPKAVMRWAKLVLAQAGKMTELLEALRRCRELLPVKVRDIQSQPHEDYVYDISVAENENFLTAEGVFVHNSRAGAQVPFSSINLGTDTSTEGRMVTRAMLLAYEKGLGRGEHPLFPNIVFKVKDGVNSRPGDPNYDLLELAFRVSSTRLFPTYSFMDSSFNRIYDDEVAYMGCRTRVIGNVNGPEVTDGRGNLSFTSVNLPRVAFEALRNVWNIPEVGPDGARSDGSRRDADASAAALAAFFSRLDETLDLTKRQLLHRYNVQKNLKVKDFPFLMGQKLYLDSEGLKPDDPVEKAFRHGTLSIGFIGLAEALILLTGAHHAESAESLELADLIVGQMRQYCDRATAEESLNFSLLATPAEGLSGRFTKIDRKEFGIFPRVTDRDWYTNSFHVPVDFPVTGSKKIAIEGRFHKYCNAGHISYVELPSPPRHNSEVVEAIVRAMKEADMGYAGVNFPVDTCTACGYTNLIDGDTCPSCGSDEISRVRRITGYLSTLDRFNDAKRAEERNRKVHGL